MPAFPTTDPVLSAYQGLIRNARVVVVYNTDVSWSLTLAERYARRKHIPLGNLFGYAFGTAVHWEPADEAAIYAMTSSLETHWTAVGAQAVLMAPGCPNGVEVTGVLDTSPNPDVWYPAAIGYPDLGKLCSGVRLYNYYSTLPNYVPITMLRDGTNYTWAVRRTTDGSTASVFGEYSNYPAPTFYAGGAGFNIASWEGGTYSEFFSEYPVSPLVVDFPTETGLALLGLPQNYALPYGRIGFWWNTFGIYPQPDPCPFNLDFDTQARAMEQGLRYAEACSPDNRYRVHTHFIIKSDDYQRGLSYMAYLMDGWGYSVDYLHLSTVAVQDAWTPASGSAYTLADLEAGKIRDKPYHLLLGIMNGNSPSPPNNPYQPPLAQAWKPDGGGGAFLGPSFGYGYALQSVARGGAGALSNSSHITNGFYLGMQQMLYNLLRGMSWCEASFWSHECGQQSPPIGDPLARPFPA